MQVFRVLVVDDEAALLIVLKRAFTLMNCEMIGASTLREGLRRALEEEFDIILLDNHFPEGHCDAIVPSLVAAKPHVPIVIITANESDDHVRNALGFGVKEVLGKPFGLGKLAQTVARYCASFPFEDSRVA